MALLMSCLMSFVVSTFNMGFVDNLVFIWLKAWGVAFSIAFPAIVIVAPIVRKLTEALLKDETGTTDSDYRKDSRNASVNQEFVK